MEMGLCRVFDSNVNLKRICQRNGLGFIVPHNITVGGYTPVLVLLTLVFRTVINYCLEEAPSASEEYNALNGIRMQRILRHSITQQTMV